jgi:hypothetical protein
MSDLNTKWFERNAIMGAINPASISASTVTSGWVNMANVHQLVAIIASGALGTSATIDAKLQQAQDSSGTGAKDITGKAITQLVKASNDNNQVTIEFRDTELDTANGFCYVRLSLTVGTAASLASALLIGALPYFKPASTYVPDAASVVQHVG